MKRAKTIIRQAEIVSTQKALAKCGAHIGKLCIFPDRVEIIPEYKEEPTEPNVTIDETPLVIPLLAIPK